MQDAERFRLLGTYSTPRVRIGRVLSCEVRDCDVIVVGYSDGRIPWPLGRKHDSPQRGFIVYGGLAEAVRKESNQAVCHWFGLTAQTVSIWRVALGVERKNTGSKVLWQAYGREEWFAEAQAKGKSVPWTEERRQKMSELLRGKPLAPHVVEAIREAQKRRRGYRHTPESRAKISAAVAARLARGVVPFGRAWTPEEDELVRTLPAAEAARRMERTLDSVYKRKGKLKRLAGVISIEKSVIEGSEHRLMAKIESTRFCLIRPT